MKVDSIQANQTAHGIIKPAENRKALPHAQAEYHIQGHKAPKEGMEQILNQTQGIADYISHLKKQLDMILIHYPPFFPIGTYQRLDLVEKIKGIQEEIEKSSIEPDLKKLFHFQKLSTNSTDVEIMAELKKLFNLRAVLIKKAVSSSDNIRKGPSLNVKV